MRISMLARQNLAAAAVLSMGLAQGASAKTCDLAISGNDAMQYDKKELVVAKDCTEVKLTLTHAGKLPKTSMGHNWVLAKPADMQALVTAGMTAGAANDYIPKDPKVIASAHLVGGGESSSTTFKVADLKDKEYKFFCTFPGHSAIMNGVLKVEK
jgi:azurin